MISTNFQRQIGSSQPSAAMRHTRRCLAARSAAVSLPVKVGGREALSQVVAVMALGPDGQAAGGASAPP